MRVSIFIFFLFVCVTAIAAPTIQLGIVGPANPGEIVEVPIYLENDTSATLLQFDIFFDKEQFPNVDVSDCLRDVLGTHGWSICGRRRAPNEDVIRVIVVTVPLTSIPSGELGVLRFKVAAEAVNRISKVHIDECSALYVDGNDDERLFASSQLFDGQIVVKSSRPDVPPPPVQNRLVSNYRSASTSLKTLEKAKFRVDFSSAVAAKADELLIDVPGTLSDVAKLKYFEPRKGYVKRVGCDNSLIPDPYASTSEMSFRWYGENDFGHPTAITVTEGNLHGLITTPDGGFVLTGNAKSGYEISEIDRQKLPPVYEGSKRSKNKRTSTNATKSTNTFEAPMMPALLGASTPRVIDMMVLYTNQARADAGGQSQMDNLITASVDDINTTFANSGDLGHMSINLVHSQLYSGYVPTGDIEADLLTIQSDLAIIALRDQHKADVVSVMVRDFDGVLIPACGASFVQHDGCFAPGELPNCGAGKDNFQDFAFNWVSVECARLPQRLSFTHEFGHNLGGEHQSSEPLTPSPTEAAFPWAFSRETPVNITVMFADFENNAPTQVLHFSNPDVSLGGYELGVENISDIVRVIEVFGPEMSTYRASALDSIFEDSFESP